MSKAQQTQLLGTPSEDAAHIETDGRTLRPAFSLLTPLVDELKLTISDDCLQTAFVDPANVGAGYITIHADAFDTYEVDDDLEVALNVTGIDDIVSKARMGTRTNDSVTLDIDETRTLVAIDREYADHEVTLTDEHLNIDPASVREEPTYPPIDSELDWRADIDPRALDDVVSHLENTHYTVTERDGRLVIGDTDSAGAHDGECKTVGDFGDVATADTANPEHGATSLFSADYFRDIVGGLKAAKVTDLTVRWGTDVPAILEFERTLDETTLYEGEFLIAPRLRDSSEDDQEAA